MKIEFLMCGNPRDQFFSQAAIFRKMLDSFGGEYAAARLVLCLGGEGARWEGPARGEKAPSPQGRAEIPERWRQAFMHIDVQWADSDAYQHDGDFAQSDLVYQMLDPTADISIICDADTLLLRPLPREFLWEMQPSPALAGWIAAAPPPMQDFRKPAPPPLKNAEALWHILAHRL